MCQSMHGNVCTHVHSDSHNCVCIFYYRFCNCNHNISNASNHILSFLLGFSGSKYLHFCTILYLHPIIMSIPNCVYSRTDCHKTNQQLITYDTISLYICLYDQHFSFFFFLFVNICIYIYVCIIYIIALTIKQLPAEASSKTRLSD